MDFAFFDRTSRGRLIISGRDRMDLLHRLATNSVINLKPGTGIDTCFLTAKGRLIDWTVVLNRGDDLLLLSANPERLSGHIQQYTITEDVIVRNYMAIEIVVCGSRAADVLGVQLEPWTFTDLHFADVTIQVARIEPLNGMKNYTSATKPWPPPLRSTSRHPPLSSNSPKSRRMNL